MTKADEKSRQSEIRAAGASNVASDPFALWKLSVLTRAQFAELGAAPGVLSRAQLEHLAAYDLLAPTSHNTVPQRFMFPAQGNAIEIFLDRELILAASDPVGRQACVSLGCGIANLLQAARYYGFEGTVALNAASPALPSSAGQARYSPIARISFEPAPPLGDERVLRAMLERRSVRALYDAAIRLPVSLEQSLRELMSRRYPGLEFHLLSDAATLGFLGDLQELADSTALNREDFATELGHWLIENDSDSHVGMRGREFGLSDEMARGMHARLLSDTRLSPPEVAGFAKSGNVGMRSSSAVGVIAAPRDDLEHRVLAGRVFEDLVLGLHQQGFVTAMHAAITELESPNLALQARLGTSGRVLVVFRMGKSLDQADAQRPHSARPTVGEVTLTPDQLEPARERAVS